MIIDYSITKIHGKYRPNIVIRISVEDWEKKLNPEHQSVTIRVPNNYNCNLPSEDEEKNEDHRSEKKISTALSVIDFYLPYRPGKDPQYPEVEAALKELREKWEASVLEAYESIAFERSGKIEPSAAYKKKIAPWVAKQKMIKGVENE